MTHLRHLLSAAGALYLAIAVLHAQQPARDSSGISATGTASISGTVIVNEPNGQPVRRAVVSLSMRTSTISATRQTTTDEQGRFVFRNLPAGTYSAPYAAKPGLVPSSYGETRPGGVGSPITLSEGEKLTVNFKLLRGGVITGTLVDNGRPVALTTVSATQVRIVNGVRTPSGSRFGIGQQTDDRGVYRIYGLPPGDYLVAASPRLGANTEIRPVTESEIQWATQQLQSGAPAPSASAAFGGSPDPPPPAQPVGYTPVYYPGTTDPANAAIVTVAAGQERSGVDFTVAYIATAKLEGTVLDSAGQPANGVQLNIVPTGEWANPTFLGSPVLMDVMMLSTRPTVVNGRFTFAGVRPGQYKLFARGPAPGAAPAAGVPGSGRGGAAPVLTMWAMADVEVAGRDVSGIELRLQPGVTVPGRIAFDEASGPPPKDLSRLTARLVPAPVNGVSVSVNPPVAAPQADGSFRFEGVTPGRYLINATLSGGTPAWFLRSARIGDIDGADVPFEIQPGQDAPEIVLTFTTRMAELSGRLLDGTGKPSSALSVFLFSVDPQHWSQRTRRIRPPVRAGTDGTFRFTNVLPGEYHLAALSDYEQADIFKPEFLEEVAAASMKITIGEGEKKVQDIRIAGGK